MSLKQLTIFVENKKGALVNITKTLADNNVNLRALSIADTQDYGILRIIVDNPDEAIVTIKKHGYVCTVNNVLGVSISDTPGSFSKVLEILAENDIFVEYVYAFNSQTEGNAYMVFRVNDNAKAKEALEAKGVKVEA